MEYFSMPYWVILVPFIPIIIYSCCLCACKRRADESDASSHDIELGLPPTDHSSSTPTQIPVSSPDDDTPEVVITPRMIHEFRGMGEDGANTCCPICLEDFEPDDKVVCLSKCKHVFHPCCLDPWLQKKPSCPNCRGSVRGKGGCIEKDVECGVEINDLVEDGGGQI